MNETTSRHDRHSVLTTTDRLFLLGIAFVFRALILVWATRTIPDLFRWNLDSWEYMAMTLAIGAGDWGFYMFTLRTPGYPLILSGYKALFGLTAPQLLTWLPFQALITSVGVVLAAQIVYRLTHNRQQALIGGVILAGHPIILGAETPLLSEALFNPALTVAVLFGMRWLASRRVRDWAICLLALQVMVLTRATGLWYILVLLGTALVYDRQRWRPIVLLGLGFCLPVVIWTARNVHYTGIQTYSTAGTYNLLFYKSISTETLVSDKLPDELAWEYALEIETRLGDPSRLNRDQFPVGNFDYLYVQDPDRYTAMSQLGREKLLEYHLWHFVKVPWTAFQHFNRNYALRSLIPPGPQLLLTVISLGLFVIGGVSWWQQKPPWWQQVLVWGTCSYFILGTAFFLPGNTDSRYMSALGFCWALLVSQGLIQVYRSVLPQARSLAERL